MSDEFQLGFEDEGLLKDFTSLDVWSNRHEAVSKVLNREWGLTDSTAWHQSAQTTPPHLHSQTRDLTKQKIGIRSYCICILYMYRPM